MGKYFSDIHASCESQFRGLPHGLADTPEIAACRAEPENYEGLLSLADALCWQLRFREAIDALTRAIALAPERIEAYRKRGPKYLDTLQFGAALDDYTRCERADGVSVEYFHNWLAKPEQADAIVCFNHPQKDAYNDFHCYNEETRGRMKLIELINGGRAKFYPSFLNALAKGWKVSPVAGCDNHGWEGIAKWNARTGLLVTELTPAGVLEAMASRRTFATLDKNLSVVYRVNGKIMGSDIRAARKYKFDIEVSDPDTDRADQAIARIEVVSGSGTVVAGADFDSHEVHWKPVVPAGEKCYFVLVYNASKPETPVAYAAPVWIEP